MKEPTTAYGKALLERVSEEIRNSELGGRSNYLLFAPISRGIFDVYKNDPETWDLRLASNHDGIVTMVMKNRKSQEHS